VALQAPLREFESGMSKNSDNTATVPLATLDGAESVGDSERRVQRRFQFAAEAEVIEVRSQARVTGRCSDLGPGGCYVDALTPFAVGAEVRVGVTRDTRRFESAAVITYAHPSLGMGLKFTEISEENLRVLNSWVSELSGAPSAAPPEMRAAESAASDGNTNVVIVLNQLVALLVRKKILTEKEGTGFLRKMFQ
jgi:hypothetical protein